MKETKLDLIRYILTAYNCSIYKAVAAYQYAGQQEYNTTFAERVEHYFMITKSHENS